MISSLKLAVSSFPMLTFMVLTICTELTGSEAQAEALSEAIKEIPRAHRLTLEFLVFHLSRVIEHQDENLVCNFVIRVGQC